MAASPGRAHGLVKIVNSATHQEEFPTGAVLVSHTTDPTLIEMMLRASALVTEIGGRLCHTAIVALELGIPCVVAVDRATTLLRDGVHVRVDGTSGMVTVLEAATVECPTDAG